jgi:hypothetical protein
MGVNRFYLCITFDEDESNYPMRRFAINCFNYLKSDNKSYLDYLGYHWAEMKH